MIGGGCREAGTLLECDESAECAITKIAKAHRALPAANSAGRRLSEVVDGVGVVAGRFAAHAVARPGSGRRRCNTS